MRSGGVVQDMETWAGVGERIRRLEAARIARIARYPEHEDNKLSQLTCVSTARDLAPSAMASAQRERGARRR